MPSHDPFAPGSAVKIGGGKSDKPESAPAPAAKDEAPPAPEPAPAQTSGPQPASSENEVPQGTVKEILEWAGDDEAKIQAAYDAEHASDEPRASLINALENKLA